MAVDNTILVRRGSGTPSHTDFTEYELAYDYSGNKLYIRDGNAMVEITGTGTVDTSGTPIAQEYARFTDANTVEGRSAAGVRTDLGLNIGTNVQAYDTLLKDIADIDPDAMGNNGKILSLNAGLGKLELVTPSAGTITSVTGMTNNNVLTASGSTTISGEGNLTFDNSFLELTNSQLRLDNSTFGTYNWEFQQDNGGDLLFKVPSTGGAEVRVVADGSSWKTTEVHIAGEILMHADGTSYFKQGATPLVIGGTSAYTTGGTPRLSIQGAGINIGSGTNDMSYIRRIATGEYQWQTWNGSNDGELHLQPYGGKVGIGTATPSHTLDVVGNAEISATLQMGSSATQSNAKISAISNGNNITFGHVNSAGYRSHLGCSVNNGYPFLAFYSEAGTNNNTFRTRGLKGVVLQADTSGKFSINHVANTNADNQSLSKRFEINGSGNITTGVWQGTAIASAYLDADTAHLSGTQTFSGAKTFTGRLTISDAGADGLHLNQDTGATSNSNRLFFTGSATSAIFQSGSALSFRSGATAGSSSGTQQMYINSSGMTMFNNINMNANAISGVSGIYGNGGTFIGYNTLYQFKNTTGGILATISGSTLDLPNTGDWSFIKNNTNSGGLRFGTKDSGGTYANQIEISNTGNYVKLNENTTVTGTLTTTGVLKLQSELDFTGNGNKIIDVETLEGSNSFRIRNHNTVGNVFHDALKLVGNGGAHLYYNNSKKFETTNTGATVSGNLTVTGSISGTITAGDATTLDGYDSSRFFRRQGSASATVGPGWMTVATNTSGRRAGEILVTDGDSGDHGFIRLHWLRSYADSNFTVINTGGHSNRITGVRVLSQDSDNTYGEKILQVYVEANSAYEAKIFRMGDNQHYSDHTIHTPTIENTISGYSVHGNQLENLNIYGFAHEEGILAGGNLKTGGNVYTSNGSASSPAYSFTNDTDTGIYRNAANQIGFSTAGERQMYLFDGGLQIEQPVRLNFANDQRIFDNGSGGLSVGAESHELRLYSGGTDPIEFRMGGRNGTTRCKITYDGQYHWGNSADRGTLTWDTGKAIVTSQSGNTLELRSQNATDMIAIEANQTRFIADGTERFRANQNGLDLSAATANKIVHTAAQSRDKYRVWNSHYYAIGMDASYTFGGIGSDYVMTFQMNDSATRGFWWGHDQHTDAQGAMSLTTNGKLTVANSMRLGYGESDTTTPGSTYALDISGNNNLRLASSSDQMIRFSRSGGNEISIEHDANQMYFYNRATSQAMFMMFNSGSARIGQSANPFFEMRNTATSAGSGPSLIFGHSQGGTNSVARISSFLTDGSQSNRSGHLRFWTRQTGTESLAMQLQSNNVLRLYQDGDVTDYLELYVDDTRAYYHHAHTGSSSAYHRFITDNGYIELGPANGGWGHINTDRASFYFNRKLTVDEGIVQSYDENLSLRRAQSSADRIDIEADYTRVIVNNAEKFRVDGSGSRTLGISRADSYFQKNTGGTTGCLLKLVNSGWTNATTHDIIFNGYGTTLGDYTYLKSAGNSANTHGMLLNSDNYLFWGRDNLTTGTVDNSATAPMTDVCMRVDASGNALFDGDVVAFSSTIASDARLKENVEDLNYGLKDVLDMRAVSFDWIDKRNGQHDIGVIAQEIEKIIPEVVVEVDTLNSEDTHKTVDYAKLTSVLITAIQEQQVQIDELKTKLGE